MNTIQITLQQTYTTFKNESQVYFNTLQQYLSPIVEEVVATSLPYEVWLNNTTEFLIMYFIHLLVILSLLVLLFINYLSYSNQQKIINNQREMIDKLSELRQEKLSIALELNKSLAKTIEVYRTLRYNKTGYFLLRGDPSNREFRETMKSLGSDKRYVSNREYMVKLKHIGKFDNKNVSI